MNTAIATFWEDVPEDIKDTFVNDLGFDPTDIIANPDGDIATFTLEDKYSAMASFAERQIKEKRSEDPKPIQAFLFALAQLNGRRGRHAEAEAIWRECLHNNDLAKPDLAALYNVASCLNVSSKFSEAETILRLVTELLQVRLGPSSEQNVGCLRELGISVGGQGRIREAKTTAELWQEGWRMRVLAKCTATAYRKSKMHCRCKA